MEFQKRIEGEVVLLPLEGKLMGGAETNTLSEELENLIEKGYKKMILDFERVKWINSPGIGALIKWIHLLRENGGDLRFTNASTRVKHYLNITKLNTVIMSYDCCQDAIDSFIFDSRKAENFI